MISTNTPATPRTFVCLDIRAVGVLIFMACIRRTLTSASSLSVSVPVFTYKTMSGDSKSSTTHLDRTETSLRQKRITAATVTEISQLSQTVKSLCLNVKDNEFTFKPGQWVNFFIPNVATVGGFSFCSSPATLRTKKVIKLAIKYSDHPPALWVHTKCNVGSKVQMRVGGDFYFDPQPGESIHDLLLIAGGVGINPLYSIVQHVSDLRKDNDFGYTGKTLLLFSAKNEDELLFKDSLMKITKQCPSIRCNFFVTKQGRNTLVSTKSCVQDGRISEARLQEALSSLNSGNVKCYICGPPPMIKQFSDTLRKLDIPENRIHFEQWW